MKRKKLFGQPNIFLEWAGKSVYKSELSVFSSRETFIIFNRCSARSSVRFRTYKIYRFKNIPPLFLNHTIFTKIIIIIIIIFIIIDIHY